MDIPITQGVSTASNVTTAPNGLQQGGRISGSGVDEIQRIGYNTQTTASGQYNIFSVFVKTDSGTPILGFYSNTFVANKKVLMLIFQMEPQTQLMLLLIL